jgi:cobalt-zinc-cadmium efflux system membrane fusion protein
MNEITVRERGRAAAASPVEPGPLPTSPPAIPGSSKGQALRDWLGRTLPTALVLLALAGVAYWGHHTGWKVPSFAALTGHETAAKDDWCKAHGVPESACVECNASLLPRPKAYGWCKVHGVHDCPLDHPDVAQLRAVPEITAADRERAQRALDFAERPGNNSQCKLHPRRLQVASDEALARMGIDLRPVWQSPMEESVAGSGEVAYNPAGVARLSPPLPGRVWRVLEGGQVGRTVKTGEILALVDAAEVGKAKNEFLQALAQVEVRQKTLDQLAAVFSDGVIPLARYRDAEAALKEAQIRLRTAEQTLVNLGLPVRAEDLKGQALDAVARRLQLMGLESVALALDARTTTANLIAVQAPFDAVVIDRKVNVGEMADASKVLFVVANPGRLWLTLHVPQESLKPFREKSAARLLSGKPVRFMPDGGGGEVTGTVSWVSPDVDEKTRTLRVRAELANADGRLRVNTFGAGRVVLRREEKAVVVPNEAVHWEGKCHVVFVWDKVSSRPGSPKVFHVRTVRLGVRDAQNTEIIAGVLPREWVAVRNSGTLRAELLKDSLGEG